MKYLLLLITCFISLSFAQNDSTTICTKKDTVHWEKSVQGVYFNAPHNGDITFITNAAQYLKYDTTNGLTFSALGASVIWEADSQKTADKKIIKDFYQAAWKELKKRAK